MWSAIRSDLKEFVSTVTEDGGAVLENIESTLIEDVEESITPPVDPTAPGGESNEGGHMEDGNGLVSTMAARSATVGDDDVYHVGTGGMGYEETGIIADASDEAIRRAGLIETYTTPLLNGEVNGEKESVVNTSTTSATSDHVDEAETDGDVASTEEEEQEKEEENSVDKDESIDVSNGDLLDDEVDIKEFLASFDISSKTDEISAILIKHQETVGSHFEALVPVNITYEQFWQRYYFRCDPIRIQQEWDDEAERLAKERKEMLEKGVKSVQNIFGGALKAIQGVTTANGGKKVSSSIYEKYQAELEVQQRAMMEPKTNADDASEKKERMGLGFFSGGRPPFVMNTAVSDDDEEDYEEEEEDEEFGWGSEEEDSDEEQEEEDTTTDDLDTTRDGDEVIMFSDPNVEKIKNLDEQLSLAIEERDQLQSTVEMQKQEIERLQNSNQATPDVSDVSCSTSDEIERLKMVIFEKDSELAALKASLDDPDADVGSAGTIEKIQAMENEKELKELKSQLSLKNEELSTIQEQLSNKTSEMKDLLESNQTNSKELNEAKETISQLQTILEESTEMKNANEQEIQSLRDQVTSIGKTSEQKYQDAALDFEKTIESLKAQLQDANQAKKEAVERADALQQNLDLSSKVNEADNAADNTAETTSSPDSSSPSLVESSSVSSGVKVSADNIPKSLSDQDDDEDDDWGDAW